MSLPSLSLKRPVLAIVLNLLIILFGIIGYKFLGVREYPSIDPPIINVRTNYAGANADIIESQITEPLEKAINGISGVNNISSSSNQGSSNITVEFDLNIDLEAATNDVRDKVSQAIRSLPQDIDGPPVVSKADANSDPIISMTVRSDKRNALEVSDFAANVLQERLQTIPGVSSIGIWGEKRYAMRIWLDPQKMAANQVTFKDINLALEKENVELPAGKIYGDNTELTVRTYGRLTAEKDFNELIVKAKDARVLRLKDVGEAILGPENEETTLKESGYTMVALAITPQPGSNYIDIADEFYKRFESIKKDIPEDYKAEVVFDNTKFIRKSISEVEETLIIALSLVVFIIYIFFRNWKIAFRPLIDIPVSLIGAFFIMYLFGFSINVLTLLGIVLATGLVVDDGIVVTENIFKKMEKGLSKEKAAKEGAEEIYFAVLATSITLAIVFLPILFLQGFVGRLFKEFGIVVAGAVLISAFVSLTLTPVLNLKLASNTGNGWFYNWSEPFFAGLDKGYKAYLQSFMKRRYLTFPLIIFCFLLIWFFGKDLQSEVAPLEDRSFIRFSVTAPEGTSYDYMEKYIDRISKAVMDSVPERSIVLSVTSPGFTGTNSVNTGFVRLMLKDPEDRKRTQMQIANDMNKSLQKMNEGKVLTIQSPTISAGGGGPRGLPVQYVLQNNNFEKIREVLPKFMAEVSKSNVFQGFDVNLKFNKPELGIKIDRSKANDMGVSVADISQTLQLALSGRRLGYFTRNGKQYQVIGQVSRSERDEPVDLKSFYVYNRNGGLVQLDNFVELQELSNSPQIFHFNRYKSATVSAGLAPGKTIGDAIDEMDRISKLVLDESFSTALTGQAKEFKESASNTSFAFFLALILIFLILAAQFESFIDPIIIMATVPLAIAGAIVSLWYFDQTLNIFSQIGIIMLIGLVTKNGILIVEFANQLCESGMPKSKAVVEAAAMRLRPILMTTLATSLGALPIALALGASSKSRMSLGIVIVGGLLFSLMLTLFIIPALYSYMSRNKNKVVATE